MSSSDSGSVTHHLRLAGEGNRDSQAWLWERHRLLLSNMAADHRDAHNRIGAVGTSDLVGEVSVRFVDPQFFANVKDRKHFRSLLRMVVSGHAIDRNRRESLRQAQLFDDAHSQGKDDLNFLVVEMQDLLEELPLDLYNTWRARIESENERDAASKLGITRHAFRKRWERIRLKLSELLEGTVEE